jgi:hypothetical protein
VDERFSSLFQRLVAVRTSTTAIGLQLNGGHAGKRIADRHAPRNLQLALRQRAMPEEAPPAHADD